MQHLATANPHVFVGVPRFFEKLHAGIEERLAGSPAPARRLARWGLATGTRPRRTVARRARDRSRRPCAMAHCRCPSPPAATGSVRAQHPLPHQRIGVDAGVVARVVRRSGAARARSVRRKRGYRSRRDEPSCGAQARHRGPADVEPTRWCSVPIPRSGCEVLESSAATSKPVRRRLPRMASGRPETSASSRPTDSCA